MATYKYNMAQTIGQCASPLSEAFFSKENINNIQIHLKNRVRCKTGYTIDAQSEQDLLIIMRALYALHAQNPTTSAAISAEVQRLNELVLADIVPWRSPIWQPTWATCVTRQLSRNPSPEGSTPRAGGRTSSRSSPTFSRATLAGTQKTAKFNFMSLE